MLSISTHSSKTSSFPSAPDKFALEDLTQARAVKEANPQQAEHLYAQVEATLLKLIEQQGMQPLASGALSETADQVSLRQCIAQVYFEHGQVCDALSQTEQAQACYQQAQEQVPLNIAITRVKNVLLRRYPFRLKYRAGLVQSDRPSPPSTLSKIK
jgi:tetratricopeptide (TPR) repeat protein